MTGFGPTINQSITNNKKISNSIKIYQIHNKVILQLLAQWLKLHKEAEHKLIYMLFTSPPSGLPQVCSNWAFLPPKFPQHVIKRKNITN